MFLCPKCCNTNNVDPFYVLVLPTSYGPCEDCKRVTSCLDVPASNRTTHEAERQGDAFTDAEIIAIAKIAWDGKDPETFYE